MNVHDSMGNISLIRERIIMSIVSWIARHVDETSPFHQHISIHIKCLRWCKAAIPCCWKSEIIEIMMKLWEGKQQHGLK